MSVCLNVCYSFDSVKLSWSLLFGMKSVPSISGGFVRFPLNERSGASRDTPCARGGCLHSPLPLISEVVVSLGNQVLLLAAREHIPENWQKIWMRCKQIQNNKVFHGQRTQNQIQETVGANGTKGQAIEKPKIMSTWTKANHIMHQQLFFLIEPLHSAKFNPDRLSNEQCSISD